ncbi:MAG: methionine--tRNA ligase subunit beta, partial [Bacteroidota bacterium]
WKKWKEDKEAVHVILYTSIQIIAQLGILAKTFLPKTADKIFDLLQVDGHNFNWDTLFRGEMVNCGHKIYADKAPKILFEQITDEAIEVQLQKLAAEPEPLNPHVEPQKAEITYDDFQKMDMRVGTILEAEKVPKTKKLLKFLVDTGIDTRTIVSGVAEYFEPEDLVGKQVTVLVNLAPRKIRGVESQGMLLFAEDASGKLHRMHPAEDVEPGSMVN